MADKTTQKRYISLSVRVSIIMVVVVLSSVAAITVPFVFSDFRNTVEGERARVTNAARAFSAVVSAPVADADLGSIYQALRGISDVPHATFIQVTDNQGSPIAEIGNSVQLSGRDGQVDDKSIWSLFRAETIVASAPVRANGRQIAQLSIHSDLQWLRDAYLSRLLQLLGIAVACAGLTALIARATIHRTLLPLQSLSASLRDMKHDGDLARRFDAPRNDEVGVLSHAFNDALDTIAAQNTALRNHRDSLEETVKQRTAQLSTAMEEAQRANAAKSDFLATMSHEIRTPMNGLMVMAELLSKSNLQPRQRHFAEVISRSGNALLHIINDTLDMSKIEAGKLQLEAIPFDPEVIVHDVISLFSGRAEEKNLALTCFVDPAIAKILIGDPTRLSQIVGNLVNNALKFTERGGVTIELRHIKGDDSTQSIQLCVKDTGIGIAPEKLDRVFEAFSQADQSTSRRFGGTGLGLTICKKLAEGMGGTIGVDSLVNVGTTFTVSLTLPIDTPASRPVDASGHSIYLAINDPVHERAVMAMLTADGFNVFGADDKIAGQPDAVLVSPDRVAAMAKAHAGTPVIAVAPFALSQSRADAETEVAGHLSLPMRRDDVARLADCLETGSFDELAKVETDPLTDPLSSSAGLKILAVDDNAVNRQVISDSINALGGQCDLAENGADAVELARARSYDLIFMDCSMPGMDGFEATRQIRRLVGDASPNSAHAHIVALTAHVTGLDANTWRDAGMDAYIAKPFRLEDIAAQLRAVSEPESAAPQPDLEAEKRSTAPQPQGWSGTDVPLLSVDTLAMFAAIKQSTGDDLAARIFPMFATNATKGLEALKDAVRDGKESAEIRALAHSLKSMCSSAGAQRASMAAGDIEGSVEGADIAEIDLEPLSETLDQTIAAMQAEMALKEQGVSAVSSA
ncbi:MAG: ATP-binding protein [Pseudomonadota bacterium]